MVGTLNLLTYVKDVTVVLFIFVIHKLLVPLTGHKFLCCQIARILLHKRLPRRRLRAVEIIKPAALRQYEGRYRDISGILHNRYLIGNGVDLGISFVPKVVYLIRPLVSQPSGLRNGNITALFKEAIPIPESPFETDIVNSSLRPDQVEILILEGKIAHRPYDPLHSFFEMIPSDVLIENVDEAWKKVYAYYTPGRVLSQHDRLRAGAAPEINDLRIFCEIVNKTKSFERHFNAPRTLSVYQ